MYKEQFKLLSRVLLISVACVVLPGCDDDAGGGGHSTDVDGGADSGTDTDTDADTDTEVEEGWSGVSFSSINAPDEFTVSAGFAGAPPAVDAANTATYTITSDVGDLAVEAVSYDSSLRIATITTAKQKLGVTYTLTAIPPSDAAAPFTGDFLSADSAKFWVYDFATGGQYDISAERVDVGESCVVYIEEGYSAPASNVVAHFDEDVFPLETEMFTSAPDMDGNGKIVILGLDGGSYYGGYFDPTNTLTDEQTMEWWGTHSNAMEIIHINVAGGDFDSEGTIVPHEFQHLLYQERHGFAEAEWTYHNEGLAECAVRAVMGDYPYAIDFYFWDYQGRIAEGLSLVDWNYALYENYVVAFLFWSYAAAQIGGADAVDVYSDIFDLDTGSPAEVEGFLVDNLGLDFGQVQLNQMIATFAQEETGAYGYEGFLELGGQTPPHAASGTTSYDLEPFGGTYFLYGDGQTAISYPDSAGANIVYAGVNGSGALDLEEPFDVAGGALVVLNANMEYESYPTEHSGPDVAPTAKASAVKAWPKDLPPAWRDPPPRNPFDPAAFEAWQRVTEARLLMQ